MEITQPGGQLDPSEFVSSISAEGQTPLTGDVILSAGSNITLTQIGQNIEIASTGSGDSFWAANGDDIYNTNDGNVGIGTAEPIAKLEVNSFDSELLTNGNFDGNTDTWTLGAGWSYNTNQVFHVHTDGDPMSHDTFAPEVGKTYMVSFTIPVDDYVSGFPVFAVGGNTELGVELDTPGTYTFRFTASTTDGLVITPSFDEDTGDYFEGNLTDISIKEIEPPFIVNNTDLYLDPNGTFGIGTIPTMGNVHIKSLTLPPEFTEIPSLSTALGAINSSTGWFGSGFLFSFDDPNNAFSMVYNGDSAYFGKVTDSTQTPWFIVNGNAFSSQVPFDAPQLQIIAGADDALLKFTTNVGTGDEINAGIFLDGAAGAAAQLVIGSPNGTNVAVGNFSVIRSDVGNPVQLEISNTATDADSNSASMLFSTYGNDNTGGAALAWVVHRDDTDEVIATMTLQGDKGSDANLLIDTPNGTIFQGSDNPLKITNNDGDAFVFIYNADGTAGVRTSTSNGTVESPTQTLTNEVLFDFSSNGYGTTGYTDSPVASINIIAAENYTDSAYGGFITFNTVPIGGDTGAERLRIGEEIVVSEFIGGGDALVTSNNDGELGITSGLPAFITDTKSLTGQVADITTSNLNNDGNGQYRISYTLITTSADLTAGAIQATFGWTDDAGSTTSASTSVILTTLGRTQGTIILERASGNITYAVAHTGIFGTATYSLYTTLEKLQ